MSIDKWTLESALDAAVDCLNRHLPGYIQSRLDADAERDRPLINGKLPVPKVVTTGMLDDLAADWVTPSIFLNATSTSYQNFNASSLLDSQPRVTATILMAEGDIDTSEQRVYSNALSMYSDGVRYILSTVFPEDGGCEVGVQAATPDSVQYSPLVRPDGYPVWLRWSEVSIVWTQRVVNSWSTDPPPWDPLTLDPLGWWDPLDASTLFVDAAGTIPAVVGDPVGMWASKGTAWYAGNASQTVSANRPLLRPDGVEFGPSTVSLVTNIVSTALPVEMWVVATNLASAGATSMIGNRTAGTGSDGACVYMVDTNSTNAQVRDGATGTPQTAANNVTSLAPKQVIRAEISQSEVAVTGNGTRVAKPVVPPMSANMPGTAFRLGAGGVISNWIAHEIFYFDRALTAGEAAQLRAYLEAKHGI